MSAPPPPTDRLSPELLERLRAEVPNTYSTWEGESGPQLQFHAIQFANVPGLTFTPRFIDYVSDPYNPRGLHSWSVAQLDQGPWWHRYDATTGAFLGTVNTDATGPLWQEALTVASLIGGLYAVGTALTAASGTIAASAGSVEAADAVYAGANTGTAMTDFSLSVGEGLTTTGGFALEPTYDFGGVDLGFDDAAGSFDFGGAVDYGSGILEATGGESMLFPTIAEMPPADAFLYPIPDIAIAPATSTITSATNYAQVLREVSAAALATVQTVTAFRNAGRTVQQPTTATRQASATSGMVLTRNADGTWSAARPAVGVATATPDGGLIVNNGDGTYDVISPDGTRTRRGYATTPAGGTTTAPAGTIAGVDSRIVMGAAALVAVLALSKRR